MRDPNNNSRLRVSLKRQIEKRLSAAESIIQSEFSLIRRKKSTQKDISNNADEFTYDIDATGLANLESDIQTVLDVSLRNNIYTLPAYYERAVEQSTRAGALSEAQDFNVHVIGTAATLGVLVKGAQVQEVDALNYVIGQEYNERLASNVVASNSTLKTLSTRTAADVFTRIRVGIKAKIAPSKIKAEIKRRFEVAESGSASSVTTDLNRIYNQSRIETGAIISKQTGLNTGVLHISALVSTTRTTHAARHGKVYSRGEQNTWWEQDNNKYGCLCSVRPILVDRSGNVLDELYKARVETEGIDFFGRDDA